MPEPITMLVIGGALLMGLMLWAWPYIRAMFQDHLLPFIRRQLGDTIGTAMANMIYWIDNPMSFVRGQIKGLYKLFTKHVLGIETTYKRISAQSLKETTTTYLQTESGQVMKQVVEQEVPWENLPAEVRHKMIEQGAKAATMDVKATLENQLRKTASDQGMVLTDSV